MTARDRKEEAKDTNYLVGTGRKNTNSKFFMKVFEKVMIDIRGVSLQLERAYG